MQGLSASGLDATVRRVRALRPVWGAGGDAVVDRGGEEMLEFVDGFEVEAGGLVVAQQQSLLFQGAGDAGGDGVEQALEFGVRRCNGAVATGLFVIERISAVDKEHVQVDVERHPH